MFWPLLTFSAFGLLLFLHFRWKKKFAELESRFKTALQETEQRQTAISAEFRTRQEALFNSMTEGVLLLDDRGRITLANRAFHRLFGLEADVSAKTIMEAVRVHELADLVSQLGPQNPSVERELKFAKFAEKCVQVNGAAVLIDNARHHNKVLVFHDLTRLKQLENARKEFVANVSHELRTPLSLIKGYVETLLGGAKDNPEIAVKFLTTIQRSADRLELLVEDLLVISELESGRITLNLQAVSLKALAAKVLEDFEAKAEPKQITMEEDISELVIRADPGRVEQVLGNLIDNAIKYGKPGGRVTVSGQPVKNGFIEVTVADDGPGMPPESLDRVFERFYRIDKGRSREQGGTGLGLAIVKHIVQSHGGRVWATSQPGEGATFHFTLPQETGAV
jgi:two-component system phosphate regulon sensor histidine kinase PhoR